MNDRETIPEVTPEVLALSEASQQELLSIIVNKSPSSNLEQHVSSGTIDINGASLLYAQVPSRTSDKRGSEPHPPNVSGSLVIYSASDTANSDTFKNHYDRIGEQLVSSQNASGVSSMVSNDAITYRMAPGSLVTGILLYPDGETKILPRATQISNTVLWRNLVDTEAAFADRKSSIVYHSEPDMENPNAKTAYVPALENLAPDHRAGAPRVIWAYGVDRHHFDAEELKSIVSQHAHITSDAQLAESLSEALSARKDWSASDNDIMVACASRPGPDEHIGLHIAGASSDKPALRTSAMQNVYTQLDALEKLFPGVSRSTDGEHSPKHEYLVDEQELKETAITPLESIDYGQYTTVASHEVSQTPLRVTGVQPPSLRELLDACTIEAPLFPAYPIGDSRLEEQMGFMIMGPVPLLKDISSSLPPGMAQQILADTLILGAKHNQTFLDILNELGIKTPEGKDFEVPKTDPDITLLPTRPQESEVLFKFDPSTIQEIGLIPRGVEVELQLKPVADHLIPKSQTTDHSEHARVTAPGQQTQFERE